MKKEDKKIDKSIGGYQPLEDLLGRSTPPQGGSGVPDNNEKLQFKSFNSHLELMDWANSKDGTDYIISIIYHPKHNMYGIFYIK